jgi:hypothetical protein
VSVAGWLGSYASGFRAEAGEVVRGVVSSVRCGAGQGWCRIGGTLACRCMCRAGLDGARVHGNAPPILDALGSQLAPRWHGRGIAHARSRAGVARGIVRGCTEGLDGEVTVREAVGAGLLTLGVHGGVSASLG